MAQSVLTACRATLVTVPKAGLESTVLSTQTTVTVMHVQTGPFVWMALVRTRARVQQAGWVSDVTPGSAEGAPPNPANTIRYAQTILSLVLGTLVTVVALGIKVLTVTRR